MNRRSQRPLTAMTFLASIWPATVHAQSFTTIEYPMSGLTEVWGIDGDNRVGWTQVNPGPGDPIFGFLYDGTGFTRLNYPGAAATQAFDIDAGSIVGSYRDPSFVQHGFHYDGANWSTIDYPGSFGTFAYGVDGANVVGWHLPGGGPGGGVYGFLFDGANYTSLSYPGSTSTEAYGIDGAKIVGTFSQGFGPGSGPHGFLYDGATYTQLDYPGSIMTRAYGISGENIVGSYVDTFGDQHAFVYDGRDWQTIDPPFSSGPAAHGVDGDQIVGRWGSGPGRTSGFQMTKPVIPEAITFRFTGQIVSVDDEAGWFDGSFQLGDAVDGQYTIFAEGYSTGIFGEGSPRRNYDFSDGSNPQGLPALPVSLSFESGGQEYRSYTRIPGVTRALSIQLINNGDGVTASAGDHYSVVTEIPFPENFHDFTFDPLLDPNGLFFPLPRLTLAFSDETGAALDSLELPLTAPDLAHFTSAFGTLRINDGNGGAVYATVRFRIDSVTAVPEPTGGALCLGGVALAACRRRRLSCAFVLGTRYR